MKLPEQTYHTVGLNTFNTAGLIILTAVCWSQISPWWLLVSIPTMFIGFGLEIHQNRKGNIL